MKESSHAGFAFDIRTHLRCFVSSFWLFRVSSLNSLFHLSGWYRVNSNLEFVLDLWAQPTESSKSGKVDQFQTMTHSLSLLASADIVVQTINHKPSSSSFLKLTLLITTDSTMKFLPLLLLPTLAYSLATRPMKVTVFGGTGYVGSAVCERLIKRGHEVTAVSRRGVNPKPDSRELGRVSALSLFCAII